MKIEEGMTQSGFESPHGNQPASNVGKIQLIALILAVILAICGFSIYRDMEKNKKLISEQKTELTALKAEIEEYEAALAEKEDTGSKPNTTTQTSGDPKAKHGEIAKTFLKTMLTWDSYKNYSDIRTWLSQDYGVAADSQLLTAFMPEVTEDMLGDSNMRFSDLQIYELKTEGDIVEYFAICNVKNRIDGNVGNGKVAVFYTIDKQGTVSNITAYALAR